MGGFFEEAVGESLDTFREPATSGADFVPLPENSRVLAKVEAVSGRTNKNGELYASVTLKALSLQSVLPEGNYGHPKLFDNSRLTIPKPMAAYAGQPEETIAKKKKSWQILIRRTEALGLDPRTASDLSTETSVSQFYGQAVGNQVILVLGTEPAVLNEDGSTKYRAKNTVKEYYPVTENAVKKYGFVNESVEF